MPRAGPATGPSAAKPKVVRERVVDDAAVARAERRAAAAEAKADATVREIRERHSEARMDAAEARTAAKRMAAKLERAEATIGTLRGERRELKAAGDRLADELVAAERLLERARADAERPAEVVTVREAAPEAAEVRAAQAAAARDRRAALDAELRAARAERELRETVAALRGEARRLTAAELAELRDERAERSRRHGGGAADAHGGSQDEQPGAHAGGPAARRPGRRHLAGADLASPRADPLLPAAGPTPGTCWPAMREALASGRSDRPAGRPARTWSTIASAVAGRRSENVQRLAPKRGWTRSRARVRRGQTRSCSACSVSRKRSERTRFPTASSSSQSRRRSVTASRVLGLAQVAVGVTSATGSSASSASSSSRPSARRIASGSQWPAPRRALSATAAAGGCSGPQDARALGGAHELVGDVELDHPGRAGLAGAVGVPLLGELLVRARGVVDRGIGGEPEHGVRVHRAYCRALTAP